MTILFLLFLLILALGVISPAIESIIHSKKRSMDKKEVKTRFLAGTLLLCTFLACAYMFWLKDGNDPVLLRNLITKP